MVATDQSTTFEPYRQELFLHCYRMLGSVHDAEDAVQEAMLRAWRHFHTFTPQGPNGLRNWLYTIATNVSMDALKKRSARQMPQTMSPAWDSGQPVAPRNADIAWLEPITTTWLTEAAENPEARYTRQESVSLAFLTVLQLLPARQRATLLLADVLTFQASEIAALLDMSLSAVNSALHRARGTLKAQYQREVFPPKPTDTTLRDLLARYLRMWENEDVDGLVALLKEDATLSMPPVPAWYQGRAAIHTILQTIVFAHQRTWKLEPAHANGQPAFLVSHLVANTDTFQPVALHVLTVDDTTAPTCITSITAFLFATPLD